MEEEIKQIEELKEIDKEEEKKEVQVRLLKPETIETKREEIQEVLKNISPGTTLRTGIEGVLKAKTGGLIVVENEFVDALLEGGFKVNCRFTPQRLIELSKMDGAIVISSDLKKIVVANTLLAPNNSIPSEETGTRHKAAERSAKQAGTAVIAISQRRDEITLFYKNKKYVIQSTNEVVRRTTEVLQILEKHKEIFERMEDALNKEEIKKRVGLSKPVLVIQRGRIILKISEKLKRYLIELGIEGAIIKTRAKELLYGVDKEVDNVISDYSRFGVKKTKRLLESLSYDELLEQENIKQCLGISDEKIIVLNKGKRILEKAGINEEDCGRLIGELKSLNNIFESTDARIIEILGSGKENVLEKLKNIKSGIMDFKK